ncbi:MAG: hemolysin family protein [Paludibacter sp.]
MEFIVLTILILLNGFFALSEIAVVSSKSSRLEGLKAKGSKGAIIALRLQGGSENFLSAIQVGITLISIVTGLYGGASIAENLVPFFMSFEMLMPYAYQISLSVAVIVITYLSIVIGELVPKSIALSKPEQIAVAVAPIIYYFSKALFPFVWVLSSSTNVLIKLLGVKKQMEQLTEAELRQMIKTASNEGVIEEEQNEIHEKLFYFSDKKAYHIMTHRTDIEWLDINESPTEIRKFINNSKHSKIICCDDSLDSFKGVMYVNEYYRSVIQKKPLDINALIKEPFIVPEKVDAQKVLNELRRKENRVCFVVNEYGGFEGIITMYDILENLVGEMQQEGEKSEPDIFVREDASILINGDAPVEILADVIEGFEIDFSETEYSTVAGFALSKLNHIPTTGEKFESHNYSFEIIDMDGNRIDKLLLVKMD